MLFLVRHGQSEANAAGLLVGRADSALTDLGRQQALALGQAFASGPRAPCRIVTSPLQRARQTADAIAAALAFSGGQERLVVEVDWRYVELDYGELDETAPQALPAGMWERWRSDNTFRPPGGETLGEVAARVATACEEVASEAIRGDVVVVSHVSPIKAAVAWALGAGTEVSWRLSLGVASITRVRTGGEGGPVLVSFNETAHLGPLLA